MFESLEKLGCIPEFNKEINLNITVEKATKPIVCYKLV
jgi:hypothetical protein